MPGTFILSLDCEGKWGMADHLTADDHRWLTSVRLREAYRRLLALFAEHRIDATFAFVMALLLSPNEQRSHEHLFQDHEIKGVNWLTSFRTAQAAGNLEGWSLPELLDMVGSRDHHEIGCHGFSHIPLGEVTTPLSVMRREIAAAAEVAAERNIELKTFVYPRNLVGHPAELQRQGYDGYRDRLPVASGAVGRALNLAAELDVFQAPQPRALETGCGDVVAIPSGFFFNWRLGARSYIPRAVTALRWKRMLAKSVARDEVVHLWLHPHNLISAPETFDVLDEVLQTVVALRDSAGLGVMTQAQYCASPMPG